MPMRATKFSSLSFLVQSEIMHRLIYRLKLYLDDKSLLIVIESNCDNNACLRVIIILILNGQYCYLLKMLNLQININLSFLIMMLKFLLVQGLTYIHCSSSGAYHIEEKYPQANLVYQYAIPATRITLVKRLVH